MKGIRSEDMTDKSKIGAFDAALKEKLNAVNAAVDDANNHLANTERK